MTDDSPPGPVVRPVGYVEDGPVIRTIGDRDLFLGNEHAADPATHDRRFAYVVSATADPRPLTTHHRPLTDGPGNAWPDFERAVDTARTLYRRDGSVLVHCRASVSRSSTLLAVTLAAEEGRPLRDAFGLVRAARPCATPHPALVELAVAYLADRDGPVRGPAARRARDE